MAATFRIPDAAVAAAAAAPQRCPSTAPDQWTISCQLDAGHDGVHRNNMTVWNEPQTVRVGGVPVDLTVDSDAWVNGAVLLSHEQEPDL